MKIREFLSSMEEKRASDLFLSAGSIPRFRIDGKVCPTEAPVATPQDMQNIVSELLDTEEKKKKFKENLDIDFALSISGVGRFRVAIFMQRGTPSIVVRFVKGKFESFEDLNLPTELFKKLSLEHRGLILVTGAAGTGKSTAIASMLEYMNFATERHIITIEDPIEFLFKNKRSIINQRELGLDVVSYASALRHFTLESPDVIFIGLIRDPETMRAAIQAAEMGVLVVTTFHTINAVQTIERIINFFPPYLHNEVKVQLSLLLKGIIALRLVPRRDAPGRIPAYETMVLTPSISRLIREGKFWEIPRFIEEGDMYGMQTFTQSLVKLIKEGKIAEQEAKNFADNREELGLALSGVKRR
ncbi:MAG: PilT/PilU family type 4a pilus ATPase [Candidatus Omnitrophica bacterium]|nr:PilT/PilU family type 4a pilus ATPase [Candidatus Omnitrophota bacterium]